MKSWLTSDSRNFRCHSSQSKKTRQRFSFLALKLGNKWYTWQIPRETCKRTKGKVERKEKPSHSWN